MLLLVYKMTTKMKSPAKEIFLQIKVSLKLKTFFKPIKKKNSQVLIMLVKTNWILVTLVGQPFSLCSKENRITATITIMEIIWIIIKILINTAGQKINQDKICITTIPKYLTLILLHLLIMILIVTTTLLSSTQDTLPKTQQLIAWIKTNSNNSYNKLNNNSNSHNKDQIF